MTQAKANTMWKAVNAVLQAVTIAAIMYCASFWKGVNDFMVNQRQIDARQDVSLISHAGNIMKSQERDDQISNAVTILITNVAAIMRQLKM